MNRMKRMLASLLFFLAACKAGPVCFLTSADIQKQSPQPLLASYGPAQKISSLADPGWDSTKGGVYLFYPDGHLKSYTFYLNDKKPVYREEYNENGVMVRSEGSPMVDRVITEVDLDSAYFEIYFFGLQKTFRPLQISINHNTPIPFTLTADSTYSGIRSVAFGLNTKDMTRLDVYSRVEYLDDCSKADHVLTDTLRLLKDPHLEPAPAK
jgi:hypothetical protein